ncbi:MAG: hypothetical protein ACRDQ0_16750 [Pseudonocardia sp.]
MLTIRWWSRWQVGPERDTGGPVIVSVTDFTAHSPLSLPGIARAGVRLGMGWYGLPGAVGLYLWTDPLRRRTGSVSVWTDKRSMRRWVGLPLHVEIMRRYRTRGALRSHLWERDVLDRRAIRAEANRILDGHVPIGR